MRLANQFVVIMVLLTLVMPAVSQALPRCTEEDREYTRKSIGDDPDQAYETARVIQKHVENRDLAGLFSLVDGELRVGPRRRFVAGRTFGDIFTEEWRRAVIEDENYCRPIGWRGFMLGHGHIWFGSGGISRILDWKPEPWPPQPVESAWRSAGRIIEPECFKREWLSSENYSAFPFSGDFGDFRRNPGLFFGYENNSLDPAPLRDGTEVRLVTFPPTCEPDYLDDRKTKTSLTVRGTTVHRELCDGSGRCFWVNYSLLAPIPLTACGDLAPHLAGVCESAYLVEVADYLGGSMGAHVTYHIYGLFALEDGRRAIVPLVNFNHMNDAKNFVDDEIYAKYDVDSK